MSTHPDTTPRPTDSVVTDLPTRARKGDKQAAWAVACGEHRRRQLRLVAGPGVWICAECIRCATRSLPRGNRCQGRRARRSGRTGPWLCPCFAAAARRGARPGTGASSADFPGIEVSGPAWGSRDIECQSWLNGNGTKKRGPLAAIGE